MGFLISIALGGNVALADSTQDGNWRQGRVYYRLVCTSCHIEVNGKAISPSEYTIEEWKAYLDKDLHASSGNTTAVQSVRYYLSRRYRESVKDINRAAKKFLDIPEEELFDDLRAFLIYGAKDSETPQRCR